MSKLINFLDTVERVLHNSLSFTDLSIKVQNDYCILLTSLTCNITLSTDRYYDDLRVDIANPGDSDKTEYFLPYILHVKGISLKDELQKLREEINERQPEHSDVAKLIWMYGEIIGRHCKEILNGDFSFRRKYVAYKDDLDRLYLKVATLDLADPIKMKYSNEDPTWMDDLRKRLNEKNRLRNS